MAYLEGVPKYAFGTTFDFSQDETDSRMKEDEFKEYVIKALRLGCRHFDCSPIYKTQKLVGEALKEAIDSKIVSRKELFITSKLPPNMMRTENIETSIRKSLDELKLDYLDLFLIHAPFSTKYVSDDLFYPTGDDGDLLLDDEEGLLEAAWMKLVELKQQGFCKYIGLSNINLEQLLRLNKIFQVDVVQNEYHMYNQDRELFDQCEEIDVHYEAYAAFGSPEKCKQDGKPCFINDKLVNRISKECNLTIAQVNIQWIHHQPLSYVIKCDDINQLKENLDAVNSQTIPINDMIELDSLNRNVRVYCFDEHKGITKHREYPFKDELQNNGSSS